MKRSNVLSGFLAILVLSHWIITFFFYKRLPEKLIFPADGTQILVDNYVFILFAVITSILTLFTLILSRFKLYIPFFGKKGLDGVPLEHSAVVYDRAYQVVVMTVMFICMVLIYVQISIGLYSSGMSRRFDLGAALTVSPIIFIYLGFNLYILSRMARSAREHWHETKNLDEKTD